MTRENSSVPNDIIYIQDRCSTKIMDVRRDNRNINSIRRPTATVTATAIYEKRKPEFRRTFSSQSSPKRLIPASYFSLESLILLVGLTASLLFLPLILPPLPPPPFMLLLVPIGILGVLMILAFMPTSNTKDATYTYM